MVVLDALFGADCAGCGRPGRTVCPRCQADLNRPARLSWPRPSPPGLPPPWAVVAYAGSCRSLLLAYKERGVISVGKALGVPLAAAIEAAAGHHRGDIVVVPVPSTRAAIRVRGDDVVRSLTRRAAARVRRSGVAVQVVPALRHVRTVADSAGLGAADRIVNLSGAFVVDRRWRRRMGGAEVVIADDLVTTGATLAEASRALRDAGALVLGAATVAATTRRGASGLLGAAGNGATVGINR